MLHSTFLSYLIVTLGQVWFAEIWMLDSYLLHVNSTGRQFHHTSIQKLKEKIISIFCASFQALKLNRPLPPPRPTPPQEKYNLQFSWREINEIFLEILEKLKEIMVNKNLNEFGNLSKKF